MRKRQKTYHHGDLKRALVAEAVSLVDQEGAGEFTLRDLARRLGVSHTAPYRHFPDKLSLLKEVAEEGFRALFERLGKAGADLESLAWEYMQFARENPRRLSLMFGPELASCNDKEDSEAQKAFAFLVEIIRASRPGLDEDELRLRAISAWSLAHGLAVLVMNGQLQIELGKQSLEALTKRVARSLGEASGASRGSSRT